MSRTAEFTMQLREKILSEPNVILDDHDVMRALVAANEKSMGANIVDLRGIAMERLEARLDRLEDTHRNVIAAAYENLVGTNQIHRAVLALLEPVKFEDFIQVMSGELCDVMRLTKLSLVLETQGKSSDLAKAFEGHSEVLRPVRFGFVNTYLNGPSAGAIRQVTLRQVATGDERIYGDAADFIRSEACLHLHLGRGRLPAMAVLGSEDPHQFSPQHGTDLLEFFRKSLEHTLQRWLR